MAKETKKEMNNESPKKLTDEQLGQVTGGKEVLCESSNGKTGEVSITVETSEPSK